MVEEPDVEQVIQYGLRSVCSEEAEFLSQKKKNICSYFVEDQREPNWKLELLLRLRGKKVFLTIDVDGLDPSVIPGTGTPEPGGLSWQETLKFIREICSFSRVVGLDCVELAPIEGQQNSEYAAAKLIYKTISYILYSHNSG
jgi:agmatinase